MHSYTRVWLLCKRQLQPPGARCLTRCLEAASIKSCLELSKHPFLIGWHSLLSSFFTYFVSFLFLYHRRHDITFCLRWCVKMTSASCYFHNESHATRNRSLQCIYVCVIYRFQSRIFIRIENRLTARSCNVSLVIASIIAARNIDLLPSIYEYLGFIWIKCNKMLISLFIINLY